MGLRWVVLGVAMLVGVGCVTLPLLHPPDFYGSVQPYTDSKGYCTAFSINAAEGYWLTADHCPVGEGMKVGGVTAIVADHDADAELTLLRTLGTSVKALPLSGSAPFVGDPAITLGYVAGISPPPAFFGHVSALEVTIPGRKSPVTLLHEGGGPGGSGSPILNRHGEVIGVLLSGASLPSVVTQVVMYKRLVKFARRYWESP